VKICLAKDADERFQSAHDVKLQLEWIRDAGSQAGVPAPVVAHRKTRERIAWAVSALLLIFAGIGFGTLYFLHSPAQPQVIRAYIKTAPDSSFTSYNGGTAGFAISPDGSRLAYVASTQEGKSLLWVRSLGSLPAQPLDGTEGANLPFWSPDSRFIGFFADGKLKRIAASGGPPLVLCDAPAGRGGTWNRDGTILFAPFFSTPIYKVSDAGGTATPVTTIDRAKNESSHRWPWFLPDGRHFLFLAGNPFTQWASATNSIMVGSLDSPETKLLFHNASDAIYASGYLLFLQQNSLMARPFDPKRLEFTGDAVPIADRVEDVAVRVQGSFSTSDNGALAYLETTDANRQLIWYDRSGKKIGALPGADTYDDIRLSPDGKELAFTLTSNTTDIWLYDLARGVKTRFTFGSGHEAPVWSPDGRYLAYTAIHNGEFGIYEKPADGAGAEKALVPAAAVQLFPVDWSRDGNFLAYIDSQPQTGGRPQLKFRTLQPGQNSQELDLPPQLQASLFRPAHFSPDGKWLAYSSSESGRSEIYVTVFSGPGGKWQVSNGGGISPEWRRDGKELFYVSPDNEIMAAEVKGNGSSFQAGAPKPLFQTHPYYGLFTGNLFDVTADGQRFIVDYDQGQAGRTIALVANWPALLKK
jgi:eukaryotic-like serine/threonine-protein kinase